MINYYEVLQIHPKADKAIIQAAYRTLMKDLSNHPDFGGSTERAQKINEAYEFLSDPYKRRIFDKKINQWQKPEQRPKDKTILLKCAACGTLNRVKINIFIEKSFAVKCGTCGSALSLQHADSGRKKNYYVDNIVNNLSKRNWTEKSQHDRYFDTVLENDFFLKNYIYVKKVYSLNRNNIDTILRKCKSTYTRHLTPVGHYFIIMADNIEYISYIVSEMSRQSRNMKGWSCGLIIPVDCTRRQVFLSHVNLNHHPADILRLRNYIF